MRSKYLWLCNPSDMSQNQWNDLKGLRESALKTAHAWAIKEFAMTLRGHVSRTGQRSAGSAGWRGRPAVDWSRSRR